MPRHLAAAIVCVISCGLLVPAGDTRAQCDYGLTIYESAELDGGGIVYAMTVFDDGSEASLVVGGMDIFEVPGQSSIETYHVAKWSPATGWTPLGEPGEMYGLRVLEAFEGVLFAWSSSAVHRWTGSAWEVVGDVLAGGGVELLAFDDGSGGGPSLFALTRTYTSPFASRLYKLQDEAWHQVALFAGVVTSARVFEGALVVGGSVTDVDGVPVNLVASWDGRRWSDLGAGIDGSVSDLVVHEFEGDSALVACGEITLDGASEASDVTYWNGESWVALPQLNVPNQDGVGPMGVWDNGDGSGPALCVTVTTESPSSGDHHDILYRLAPNTHEWQSLGGTFYLPESYIICLAEFRETPVGFPTLFVGGKFETFDSVQSNHLVRLPPQPRGGIEAMPMDARALRGDIAALANHRVGGEDRLFAGGGFHGFTQGPWIDSVVAQFDGESWASIGQASGRVRTLKSLDDGTGPALYAGGQFSNLTPSIGQAPSRIARWDGVNWIRMGSLNSVVDDLCMHDDGSGPTLYCALSNATVVKWNAGFQTWTTISTGVYVAALMSFDDGTGAALYAGGGFSAIGGVPAANIARWRGDSIGWQAVGEGRPGGVGLLHVHDDGGGPRLIATSAVYDEGVVAQWNRSEWAAMGDASSLGFNQGSGAIATFDDGGGPALIVSNYERAVRWDGEQWMNLPNFGASALQAMGDVLCMGDVFSTWSHGVAKLEVNGIAGGGSIQPHSTITLRANIMHGGAVSCQWRRDGVPLNDIGGYFGARSTQLRIYQVGGSHEGLYDVVVTNDCTTVTSDPIAVDVIGSCVGDITIDNAVQGDDIVALVTAWGMCPVSCPSDLTHDGAVNIDDLLLLISRWGDCP
jgi:hypothetical protein